MKNIIRITIFSLIAFVSFCKKEGDFQRFGGISLNTSSSATVQSGSLLHPVVFIDIDGDGKYDGLDLNGDGIPEVLFTWPFSPSTGLDVDGDGRADYFMFIDAENNISMTTRSDGSGGQVQVIVDSTSITDPKQPFGFDTNNDCNHEVDPADTSNIDASLNPACVENKILERIYTDAVAPSAIANLTPGAYASPIDVTIVCNDNVACNAISYTFDLNPGAVDPTFDKEAMALVAALSKGIKPGDSVTVPLTGLAPGAYTIKYIARDANGNDTGIKTLDFTIGEPALVSITEQDHQYISRNPSAYNTVGVKWWSNQAGTFKIRKAGTCTQADFDGSGNPVSNASSDAVGVNASGSLAANTSITSTINAITTFPLPAVEGKKTLVLCFRDAATTIIAKKPIVIYLDDTPPVLVASPNGGNFANDKSFELSCADASGCEGIKVKVGDSDGSLPSPDVTTPIPMVWPYDLPLSASYLTPNTISYFSPNSAITLLAGPAATIGPNPYTYTYRVLVRDKAGNYGTKTSVQFSLGGALTPIILRLAVRNTGDTIDMPNDNAIPIDGDHLAPGGHYYLRDEAGLTNNGYNALLYKWKSNRAGSYQIKVGSCASGALSTGTNASGTTFANQTVASTIKASDLAVGQNDVRVCFDSDGNLGEDSISVHRWQFNPATADVTVFDRNQGENAVIDLKEIFAPGNAVMQGKVDWNSGGPTRYTSASIDNTTLCPDAAVDDAGLKTKTITVADPSADPTKELCNYVYTYTMKDPANISYGPVTVYVYGYEDKTNAIFVSNAGNDGNAGTSRTAPKKTLSSAISAATAAKKDIYIYGDVAASTTKLTVPSGVSLYGGYKTVGSYTWARKTQNDGDRTLVANVPNTITTGLTMASVNNATTLSGIKVIVANANIADNVFGAYINGGSSKLTVRRSSFTAGNTDQGSASSDAKSSYGFYANGINTLSITNSNITSGLGQNGDSGEEGTNGSNATAGAGGGSNGSSGGSGGGSGGSGGAGAGNGGTGGSGGGGGYGDSSPCSGDSCGYAGGGGGTGG